MDEIVKAALKKWPNVPACYGWLGLDARGDWYMRDDRTQQMGSFQSGQAKGSRLLHGKLIEFIGRNYDCDAQGCWFFQNGPQRVYVELIHAPWVWRLSAQCDVSSHTGLGTLVQSCLLDEHGLLYLATPLGLGLVHTQDMHLAAQAVEQGLWEPLEVLSDDLPQRFGFVRSPQQQQSKLA